MAKGDNIDDNGWDEYKRLVLAEMGRISTGMDHLTETTEQIRVDTTKSNLQFTTLIAQVEFRVLEKFNIINKEIATLKVKAGLWGTLGGGLAAGILVIALWLLQRVPVITP